MKAIYDASEKMATLDDSGIAFVVIQCESETDIQSVVSSYKYRESYRGDYTIKIKPKYNTKDNAAQDIKEQNMYEISGSSIREFKAKTISKELLNGSVLKKLSSCAIDDAHQLIYIRNIFDLIGMSEHSSRDTEQVMILNALKDIGLSKQRGESNTLIVIASTDGLICKEIESYSYIITIKHLDIDEVKKIVCECCRNNMEDEYIEMPTSLLNELAEAFRGFREADIRNTIELSFSKHENPLMKKAKVLFAEVRESKKQILKKRGGLEWKDNKVENIAGLEYLTEWISSKKPLFQNYAATVTHGINIPKGVLVSGIPGTGKSLMAKNMSLILGIPLVKMDIGSLMGKYLGESEANISRAIALAEAISPCILWIDELEKSFSGVNGGSDSNETIMRAFSSFLTWLQDRDKPCFVFATANNVNNLPPEFLRKGRFDEKFSVFMPTKTECWAIFKSHLSRKKDCFQTFSTGIIDSIVKNILSVAARKEKYMNGADIAALVDSTFQSLFIDAVNSASNEQKRMAATKRIIKFSGRQIEDALLNELEMTKTYGENMRGVCKYWLSLVNNPFREASIAPECNHYAAYLSFDEYTGKFSCINDNNDDYDENLSELLKSAKSKSDYDECFNLSLMMQIRKMKITGDK